MSAASCEVCGRRLLRDFVYCPVCGTPVPGRAASFAFESANDEATEQLFTKPPAESTLGWRPIAGALVALIVVVAIGVAVTGTGQDVAQAPTPAPRPPGEPTAASEPDSPASDSRSGAVGGDAVIGFATTNPNAELLDSLPEAIPRVAAGSYTRDYTTVLMDLAQTYNIDGSIAFSTADHATLLDLGTREKTTIALDDRELRLLGRSGIVTQVPGRPPIAQRWDGWVTTLDVDGGIDGFFFETWEDPNGWELALFGDGFADGVLAPWSVESDGSNPARVLSDDVSFLPPVELGTDNPEAWAWDDGTMRLPWDKVLARNQRHLLAETCNTERDCRLVVVDDNNTTLVEVTDSLILNKDNQLLVLSNQASVVRLTTDEPIIVDSSSGDEWDVTGGGLISQVEIVNLETASTQALPDIDLLALTRFPYWIGDALVVVPLAAQPTTAQGSTVMTQREADIIFNRAGTPVAVLEWEYPLRNQIHNQTPLRYFSPDN